MALRAMLDDGWDLMEIPDIDDETECPRSDLLQEALEDMKCVPVDHGCLINDDTGGLADKLRPLGSHGHVAASVRIECVQWKMEHAVSG